MSGIVRGSIRIRWPRPASLTWRIARATESGSYSTPTSSVAGNRRATAISHLPPPQATSRTRPPRLRRGHEVRQGRESLLEEDRDVLDGHRLDRAMEARRPLVDRPARPEELGQAGVVEARDDGRDELPAEVLRVGVVEEDRVDVLVERSPDRRPGRPARTRGRPRPTPGPARAGSRRRSRSRPPRSPPGPRRGSPRTGRARCRGRSPSSRRSRRPTRRRPRTGRVVPSPDCRMTAGPARRGGHAAAPALAFVADMVERRPSRDGVRDVRESGAGSGGAGPPRDRRRGRCRPVFVWSTCGPPDHERRGCRGRGCCPGAGAATGWASSPREPLSSTAGRSERSRDRFGRGQAHRAPRDGDHGEEHDRGESHGAEDRSLADGALDRASRCGHVVLRDTWSAGRSSAGAARCSMAASSVRSAAAAIGRHAIPGGRPASKFARPERGWRPGALRPADGPARSAPAQRSAGRAC